MRMTSSVMLLNYVSLVGMDSQGKCSCERGQSHVHNNHSGTSSLRVPAIWFGKLTWNPWRLFSFYITDVL